MRAAAMAKRHSARRHYGRMAARAHKTLPCALPSLYTLSARCNRCYATAPHTSLHASLYRQVRRGLYAPLPLAVPSCLALRLRLRFIVKPLHLYLQIGGHGGVVAGGVLACSWRSGAAGGRSKKSTPAAGSCACSGNSQICAPLQRSDLIGQRSRRFAAVTSRS